MRKLIWVVAVVAALYAGFWFVMSHYLRQGAEAAVAQMRASGRGDAAGVSLAGFPSRLDLTIDRPVLRSDDGRDGWSADFLQIFALVYKPTNVIAVFPHDQTVTLGGRPFRLTTNDMRASASFEPNQTLALDHSTADLKGMAFAPEGEPGIAADRVLLSTRQKGGAAVHEVNLGIDGLRLDPALKAKIDPQNTFPPQADPLKVDAVLTFDRPLDRQAGQVPPRLTGISDLKGDFAWGPVSFTLSGQMTVGADGMAEGKVDLSARRWRELFDLLVKAGVIPAKNAPTVQRLLESLAAQSGQPDTLALPLTLSGGFVRFGPLPLAPLPRFGG